MNPLDALSALSNLQGAGAANPLANTPGINFQPSAGVPTTGGTAPSSEAFNNLLNQPLDAAKAAAQANAPIHIAGSGGPSTWGHMVQQMVMDVNAKQVDAAQKVSDVLQGGPTPVHEAMTATEEASLSFEFLAEMRNKVVDAYNQVMQMQV